MVDNASADHSVSMIKAKYPQVRLIENHDNVGFAKANNQGFRESTGKYVMYLNSDTLVKPMALEKIKGFMDFHPEVDLMGPKLLNEDGSLQVSIAKLPNLLNSLGDLIIGFFHAPLLNNFTSFYDNYREAMGVGWISGACVVARRDAIEKLGGWDEKFFMYAEDVLLGVRAHQIGLKVWYFPEAEIIHLRNKSSNNPQKRMVQLYEGRTKLRKMIFSPASFNIYLWVSLLIVFGRASVYLTIYLWKNLVRKDSSFAQGKIDSYLSVVKLFLFNLSRGIKYPHMA